MARRPVLALLPLVAALACTDNTAPVAAEPSPLGNQFRILGTAAGGDSVGRTASCWLDLLMVLDSTASPRPIPLGVEYAGIMGGGVGRTVLEADSSGFGFFADVYWPTAVARVRSRDQVDLVDLVIGDTLQTQYRFWREIAQLRGARAGEAGATGTWTCAPFDIWEGGYVDTLLVVQGTWWTERIGGP